MNNIKAQNKATEQEKATEAKSSQIVQRLKDSLSLSEEQKSQLLPLTIKIQHQKALFSGRYIGRSLAYYNYMAENDRDSLYKRVLPNNKYAMYLEKKPSLLKND